jgi:hypothetical protein
MKRLITLLTLFGVLGVLTAPAASAQLFNEVCNEPGASESSACQDASGEDPLTGDDGLIIRLVNIAAVAGGIVAVIIIIWGGFTYVTSGSDTNKINAARNTIIYAVIGLIVIVLAQTIVSFILTRIIGT